jgi:NTE family protein
LHLVAFDVIRGEEVLLSSGPALDAVMAATAIPGILPSVPWGNWQLIDGGVVNNTPISHAVELGAERVYVLPTHESSHALGRAPRGALDAAIYAIVLLVDRRLEADVARYAGAVELVVLPPVNSLGIQPTDFSHADRLIEEGYAAGAEALAAGRGALDRAG